MSTRSRTHVRAFCAVVLLASLGTSCSPAQTQSGPESRPRWEPVQTLYTPRDDFATARVGNRIWAFGGMTGDRGTRLTSIEVYDTTQDQWRTYDGELPEGLASFEAAVIGTDVYLFGGLDQSTSASDFAAVFDTETGAWRALPPVPHPRYAHSVTLTGGKIYLIGGEDSQGSVDEVDVFDPRSQSWSQAAPMPRPRGSHDAVAGDGVVYVLGGWLNGGPTDLVQTYDPARDAWEAAPPLPEPMSRGGAAVVRNELYVSYHRFSAVLDLGTQDWAPVSPLPLSRHGLGYVAVGDRIFAIAGCRESPLRDVRTVEVLDTSPAPV